MPQKETLRWSTTNNDTAVVIIDPQNDVLSPTGKNWDAVGASVTENNTVQHLVDILAAAKARRASACSSRRTTSTPPTAPGGSTARSNQTSSAPTPSPAAAPLTLEGFAGSGADWLDEFKTYIEDGETVVVSPHKVWSPQIE